MLLADYFAGRKLKMILYEFLSNNKSVVIVIGCMYAVYRPHKRSDYGVTKEV